MFQATGSSDLLVLQERVGFVRAKLAKELVEEVGHRGGIGGDTGSLRVFEREGRLFRD